MSRGFLDTEARHILRMCVCWQDGRVPVRNVLLIWCLVDMSFGCWKMFELRRPHIERVEGVLEVVGESNKSPLLNSNDASGRMRSI